MHLIFITGSSSGIGRGLAEYFLQADESCMVVGFARRSTWQHERYKHIEADLSQLDQLTSITFEIPAHCTQISLVNNAGVIGDIKRIGTADDAAIMHLTQINVGALMVLTNRFLKAVTNTDIPSTVLNISSGAARYEIDAWAPYCASKAAVDHFSKTVQHEQSQTNGKASIFSVAPGIVDTEMQTVIRNSDPDDFSRHADFVDLKKNNELASTHETAQKLYYILTNPNEVEDVLIDVRDISL